MDINWGLIAPLLIIQLLLMVLALVDLSKAEQTNGPKIVWVFVIVILNLVGPVIYFLFGRRKA